MIVTEEQCRPNGHIITHREKKTITVRPEHRLTLIHLSDDLIPITVPIMPEHRFMTISLTHQSTTHKQLLL
ncbi:hypothetical protein JXQ70_10195 [bacterium]|nr:hypothetical protein [bacterium]